MALQQTEQEFFAEFRVALESLIQELPEGSEARQQLEYQFESLDDFLRGRDYALEG